MIKDARTKNRELIATGLCAVQRLIFLFSVLYTFSLFCSQLLHQK